MYKSPFSHKEFEYKEINEHDQKLIEEASNTHHDEWQKIDLNAAETLDGFNRLKTIQEFLKFKDWRA